MKQKAKILGGAVTTVIFLSVILILYLYQANIIGETLAALSTTGIGAFATAILALATFLSMSQTEETLEDIRREREKPMKVEVLKEVVNPCMSKTRRIKSKLFDKVKWHGEFDSCGDIINQLTKPFDIAHTDPVIEKEISEQHPDIEIKLGEWECAHNKMRQSGIKLIKSLKDSEIHHGENRIMHIMDSNESDLESVSINFDELYLKHSKEFHSYWRSQWEYMKFIEELREFLLKEKRQMMKEYGISSSEIEDESPF